MKKLLAGGFSLDEISRAIQGEEAFGFKFKNALVIGASNGNVENELEFAPHLTLPLPGPCVVIRNGAVPPQGTSEEWKGVMVTLGKMTTVSLCR